MSHLIWSSWQEFSLKEVTWFVQNVQFIADEGHISPASNQFSIPFTTSSQEKTVKICSVISGKEARWVEYVWMGVCEWVCVWLKSERNCHKRGRHGSTGHSGVDGGSYVEEQDVDKAQHGWEWTNSRISPWQSHTPRGNLERENCLKRSVGKSASQKFMQVLRWPGVQWEKRWWIFLKL